MSEKTKDKFKWNSFDGLSGKVDVGKYGENLLTWTRRSKLFTKDEGLSSH